MFITDEEAAIAAIHTLEKPSNEQNDAKASIDRILRTGDGNAHVDIHELFSFYNILYFRSLLLPRVEVSWSKRLTLNAGMCELVKDDEGKYRRIRLKLSEPLLKYRPREDTINTLLHEAIHAYFFITTSWRHARGEDGTGHCAGFLLLMDAINNHGDYLVTVYHTFHDEVDSYRTHIWQCNGPCQSQPPLFGLVKRSMNRPPSKNDNWWEKHEEECGGTYTKIMEPELTKAQLNSLSAIARAGRQKNKLDSWIKAADKAENNQSNGTYAIIAASKKIPAPVSSVKPPTSLKRWLVTEEQLSRPPHKQLLVACPICDEQLVEGDINDHLDANHPP